MSRFYAAKMEVYIPGSSTSTPTNLAHGARPHGVAPQTFTAESTDIVRASDVGFRATEDGIYPPLLNRAFEIDRAVALAPGADSVGASWGSMTLLNPDGVWDGVAASRSSDGRPITVYTGKKVYENARGIWKDPAFSALTPVFVGIAKGWLAGENELEIPLTDPTYFIEKPLQSNFYLGTGGYEGASSLKGSPKPKARGGTASYPIKNVTPVLVDATNLIYQYNDAAGTVVGVFEGGDTPYQPETTNPDVTDLYANPPSPGRYRTDNSRGLIRLGTTPIRAITLDVTGSFPTGVKTFASNCALQLLLDDIGLDSAYIDTASFNALVSLYPARTGYYFLEEIEATAAVSLFLRSIGAKLICTRTGKLRAVHLRGLTTSATPVASLGTSEIVTLRPWQLGAPLDPPADLWRVGWGHNHTVQSSDVSEKTAAARKTFIQNEWQIAGFFSSAINAAYRRPSRPAIVETALLNETDADTQATAIGALWGVRRRLYAVEVPVDVGLAREIGDAVRLSFPVEDLHSGQIGIIVGEQYRSTDATMTFHILV